jgi:hypothetical protein
MISEFICEYCNKCYKSLKTLNNHNIKCTTEQQCKYCLEHFSYISNINRHYKNCKDYKYTLKIDEIKLEIETIIKEKEQEKIKYDIKLIESKINYDNEIEHIRTEKEQDKIKYKMEYDNLFKISQKNYSEYETFISKHKKEYKDLENNSSKIINELKYKIKDHEKEAKLDKVNLYKCLTEIIKLKNIPTNITNINIIQNIVNYDTSLITGKITYDSFITKEDQMINIL